MAQPTICWSVFDHFVGLALKRLKNERSLRNVYRVVTIRENQKEKGLFHTGQEKSGKVREGSQNVTKNFSALFFFFDRLNI